MMYLLFGLILAITGGLLYVCYAASNSDDEDGWF